MLSEASGYLQALDLSLPICKHATQLLKACCRRFKRLTTASTSSTRKYRRLVFTIELSSQYAITMVLSTFKKFSRGSLIFWVLFLGLFVYAGIEKYGALLAYLKVSGYLSLALAGYLTYKVHKKMDERLQRHWADQQAAWKWIRLISSALTIGTLCGLMYLFFVIQPDKLAISYIKKIPIEALYPCSNRPLDPSVEEIAREIFRLRGVDRFDESFCNSEE